MIIFDNEDWAIKKEWEHSKLVHIKIPKGRKTSVFFRLGRKDTTIIFEDSNVNKTEVLEVDTSNIAIPEIVEVPEEREKPKNRFLKLFLLFLPFGAAITYLIQKRYEL